MSRAKHNKGYNINVHCFNDNNSSSIIKFLKESRYSSCFIKPQLHIVALIMNFIIKKIL